MTTIRCTCRDLSWRPGAVGTGHARFCPASREPLEFVDLRHLPAPEAINEAFRIVRSDLEELLAVERDDPERPGTEVPEE